LVKTSSRTTDKGRGTSCGGHHLVPGQNLGPVPHGLVRGDDGAPPLVPVAHQPEERTRLLLRTPGGAARGRRRVRRIYVASVAGVSILYTAGEMPSQAASVRVMADENPGGAK